MSIQYHLHMEIPIRHLVLVLMTVKNIEKNCTLMGRYLILLKDTVSRKIGMMTENLDQNGM